jgi:pantothenate kinase
LTRSPQALDDAAVARLAEQWLPRLAPRRRVVLGIAGIPGSGKSTLAQKLCAAVCARRPGAAVVVPMDGFHYPNAQLESLGLRHRKGAPATFDVQAYLHLLRQAREAQNVLHFPVYDRTLHEPVLRQEPGQRIDAEVSLIITEGNYLLLLDEPWSRLATLLDECWWLDTDVDQAREWIIARHRRGGRSESDALRHFEQSDRLNVELVLSRRRAAHHTFTWGGRP